MIGAYSMRCGESGSRAVGVRGMAVAKAGRQRDQNRRQGCGTITPTAYFVGKIRDKSTRPVPASVTWPSAVRATPERNYARKCRRVGSRADSPGVAPEHDPRAGVRIMEHCADQQRAFYRRQADRLLELA